MRSADPVLGLIKPGEENILGPLEAVFRDCLFRKFERQSVLAVSTDARRHFEKFFGSFTGKPQWPSSGASVSISIKIAASRRLRFANLFGDARLSYPKWEDNPVPSIYKRRTVQLLFVTSQLLLLRLLAASSTRFNAFWRGGSFLNIFTWS